MAKSKSTTQNLFGETVSFPALEYKRRFAIGEANCLECGKLFTILAGKKQRKQFCSHRCQGVYVCKQNSRNRIKPKVIKIYACQECGQQLLKYGIYCDACKSRLFTKCGARRKPDITKQCINCGVLITGNGHLKYCDKCKKKQAAERRKKYRQLNGRNEPDRGHARKRARKFGVVYQPINPIRVFERDNWHCQLCGIKTPRELRGSHRYNAPELDHIVPLSLGGSHDWANVQCACRSCNGKKGAQIKGQMLLFAQPPPKSLKTKRGGRRHLK